LLYGDIYVLTDTFVNVYMIVRRQSIILIDTGIENTWIKLRDFLQSIGNDLKDVELIVLTHHHGDHVGSLKKLVELSHAEVAAHEAELELIKSKTGIEPSIALKDGDRFGDLTVIHTPGHTPGHIALLDERTRTIFVGDLLYEEGGILFEIPHKYSMDPEGNRRSIVKLKDFDFDNLAPSHGRPLIGDGKAKLMELINRLQPSK